MHTTTDNPQQTVGNYLDSGLMGPSSFSVPDVSEEAMLVDTLAHAGEVKCLYAPVFPRRYSRACLADMWGLTPRVKTVRRIRRR